MKTMFHPAPTNLTDTILEQGLNGEGERAIILLPEPPTHDYDWISVFEVDVPDNIHPEDPNSIIVMDGFISPENLRLLRHDLSPAIAM